MRKQLSFVAATVLAAGALTFMGYDNSVIAADPGASAAAASSSGASGNASCLPNGVTKATATDNAGIDRTLAQATSAALSGQINQLTTYLAQADSKRLTQGADAANNKDQLAQKIADFKKAWKDKYNSDFDLAKNDQVVFGQNYKGFEIIQGDVTRPTLLNNWPVDPTGSGASKSGGSSSTGGTSGSGDVTGRGSGATVGGTQGASVTGTATSGAGTSGVTVTAGRTGAGDASGQGSGATVGGTQGASISGTATAGPVTGSNPGTGAAAGADMNPKTVAVVIFPAESNVPELHVSLVQEPSAGTNSGGAADPAKSSSTPDRHGASSIDATGTGPNSPSGASGSAPTAVGSGATNLNAGNTATGAAAGTGAASGNAAGTGPNATAGAAGSATPAVGSGATNVNPGSTATGTAPGTGTASGNAAGTGPNATAGTASASGSGVATATASTWKIDLPDSVDAKRLQENLATHIGMVTAAKDQWPADQNDAYRLVAHHVFMALYDVKDSARTARVAPSSPSKTHIFSDPKAGASQTRARFCASTIFRGPAQGDEPDQQTEQHQKPERPELHAMEVMEVEGVGMIRSVKRPVE